MFVPHVLRCVGSGDKPVRSLMVKCVDIGIVRAVPLMDGSFGAHVVRVITVKLAAFSGFLGTLHNFFGSIRPAG